MLKLNNVYKIYENGTLAVRNASLEFPGYGLVAIIGSSGCGKSTLLNLLSNNDIPSKGELLYNDIPYNKVDKDILNKDFAIIYQDFKLIENLSVYQNIMLSHELSNKDIDKDFVLSVADKLGITEILDEKVYSLSGGQQQRVAIARAVVRRPKVIFADEPTGNLDSENTNKVYEILKELSKEILVVIVSHDKAISQYADRMIWMQNGKVVNDYENDIINKNDKEKEDIKSGKEEQLNNATIDKKPSKIDSKSIFSYTKGKNKLRKNKSLSLNSTFGLTIAFNNKSIAKKVVLSLICAVMIGLILVSTSMIFSSYEQTFYKQLKSSEDKLISLTTSFETTKNANSENNVVKFIESNSNAKVFYTYNKNGLYGTNDFLRINNEMLPPCYENLYCGVGAFEIYIDSPEELCIKMLYGRAPVERNEIAISKTNLDYWLYCKDFVSKSSGETYQFKSISDIIGKKNFDGSSFTIVGVFDDRNASNNVNWSKEKVDNYLKNNFLWNAVLRPERLYSEGMFFDNNQIIWSGYHFTIDTNNVNVNDFMTYMPLNTAIREYHNLEELNNYSNLQDNEIVIADKEFIENIESKGNKLNIGDNISLTFVKSSIKSVSTYQIEEIFFTKTYKIVGIEKDIVSRGCVFISEEEYLRIYKPAFQATPFLINGENLKLKDIKNTSKNFEVFWKLNNYTNINWTDVDTINVTNVYIAIPLFCISMFVLFVLLSIIMSNTINTKNKELLILKSLGAKQKSIINIFSLNIVLVLLVQCVIGSILGYGILSAINIVFAKLINEYEVYFKTFWLGWENILLTLIGIVLIAGITVWYTISKLNGKNLRKLFQKQRK